MIEFTAHWTQCSSKAQNTITTYQLLKNENLNLSKFHLYSLNLFTYIPTPETLSHHKIMMGISTLYFTRLWNSWPFTILQCNRRNTPSTRHNFSKLEVSLSTFSCCKTDFRSQTALQKVKFRNFRNNNHNIMFSPKNDDQLGLTWQ